MLLVLSTPSKRDSYYRKYLDKMIDFYISYAGAVINENHDNIVILADKTAMPYLASKLPSENLLLVDKQLDPWVRDVSPVCPGKNIQFQYSGGLKKKEAKLLQKSFNRIIEKYHTSFSQVDFYNDGGNFVYNQTLEIIITTDKFLELNKITKSKAKLLLKDIFNVKQVAILPADDEKLGHVDGMCSFLDEKTLLLVNYQEDLKFRDSVLKELELLENVEIKEVTCPFNDKKAEGGFTSAYGIYVNCVCTENAVYVPVFNDVCDEPALSVIRESVSSKEVIPINAEAVCDLGGSLRCLSWEVEGENAHRLMQAAKLSVTN
ncbi:putative agmatine deiminase [Clytia hemisphaerica]|uniref:putative agmatine deiminase n=1 Tax=Clytia hemisphaerica TaxID=252671 RepID=UPI0034D7766F